MLDHRAITRLPCKHPVFFSPVGEDARRQAVFTDIGLGGARLAGPLSLEPGTMLAVAPRKPRGRAPVRFEVRWSQPTDPEFDEPEGKFQVGLAVRESMPEFVNSWMGELLADQGLRPDQIAQRRKLLRVQTEIGAKLGALDEDLDPAVIQDLSAGGAGVRSKLLFTAGVLVRLGLPAQPGTPALVMQGRIVSRRRNLGIWVYGLCFVDLSSSQKAALEQLVERRLRGG